MPGRSRVRCDRPRVAWPAARLALSGAHEEPGFEEAEQLYIDPEECIDCDACVEACPVDACFAEDQLPEEWTKYVQINAEYYGKQG